MLDGGYTAIVGEIQTVMVTDTVLDCKNVACANVVSAVAALVTIGAAVAATKDGHPSPRIDSMLGPLL